MNLTAEPNNVTINKISMTSDGGKTVDLTGLFEYMSIFEDVFSNGMSGFIKLKDSYNLPETFPIIGEETISVSFTTYADGSHEFKKSFRVHKIDEWELNPTKYYASYIIHFVTLPYSKNMVKRLNRSFGSELKPTKSTDVVSLVCDKMLGIPLSTLTFDQTRFERNIICTNWTPFQLFNFLGESDILDQSAPPKDKESTFIFYEDRDGFKFISWATLIEDLLVPKPKEIDELFFGDAVNPTHTTKRVEETQVLNYKVIETAQSMKNTDQGMYSNRIIYHDIINKTLTQSNFNYDEMFPKISHLDGVDSSYKLKTYRGIELKESTSFMPKEYHYNNDGATTRPWKQISKARIAMFENFILEAEVTGHTGQVLGNVVKCTIPTSRRNSDGSMTYYEQMSGKYLITKIRHVIDTDGYKQILELRKGSQRKVT